MGEGGLGRYRYELEAKYCGKSAPQAHKPNENLQVIQLQERCSASKRRLSKNLSAHKQSSTAHFEQLLFLIQRRR
jgi:hypothetical protein